MKYTIQWSEKKVTSTGKEKIDATLSDGTTTIDGVTIWADFPDFSKLMTGFEIEGDVVIKQNGQFTNKTLYPIKKVISTAPGAAQGFTGGSRMMEAKNKNIVAAQENKNNGIKAASSLRMAVELVIATMQGQDIVDNSVIKGSIKDWRKWLLDNWDLENPEIPF